MIIWGCGMLAELISEVRKDLYASTTNNNVLVSSHWLSAWTTRMKIVVLALLFEAVSTVLLEKWGDFCFCFYCARRRISHTWSDSLGDVSWRAELFLSNSTVSEWNGASQLFKQNTAITHSIRRSVLALTFTNRIQKSQWVFTIWQHGLSLCWSLEPIQHRHSVQF